SSYYLESFAEPATNSCDRSPVPAIRVRRTVPPFVAQTNWGRIVGYSDRCGRSLRVDTSGAQVRLSVLCGIPMESLQERVQRVLKEEVAIAPYDARWTEHFRQEEQHLRTVLPRELVGRIEHYGSTAVTGLAAKPIVDMLIEVTDLEATRARIVPVLECEGYDYFWRPTFGDNVPPWYAWFIKRSQRGGARTHHLHTITREPEFADH